MELAGLEVAMKLVVFLSAVILLHQVCDVSEYIKNGQHNHKAIVADNILLCTFIQLRSVYKQGLHCMYYAQMYAALHAGIILQRPIARALYWAWLVKVLSGLLSDCLSVCPGSACCLCFSLILGRLFFL